MDIRCSMLGHEFQATEVEREQRSNGDEEVVTVREFRECRRCGTRELVSENTHVRASPGSDAGDESDDPSGPPEAGQATLSGGIASPDGGDEPAGEEEDAEVLDRTRRRGEWPDPGDRDDTIPSGWPDHGDDGDAGAASSEDGGDASTGDRDGGDIIEAPSEEPGTPSTGTGEEGDRPARDRPKPELPRFVEVEYFCSNCGMTADPARTSLRPGDICPECRGSYVGEREV